MFQLGTYTKIFFQFNETLWNPDTQYFLYADPDIRGYWPLRQPLSPFIDESNILIATLVGEHAYKIEEQTNEETMVQAMVILRRMFPERDIPDPIAITYPRWSHEESVTTLFSMVTLLTACSQMVIWIVQQLARRNDVGEAPKPPCQC